MSSGSQLLLERVRAATEDEYTIESEIGRGGMAAVFLARDIALQRRVAIKVMLPDLVGVEGIQDRFVIEARTAAHLDHPGIVTVYSVKERDGLLFIVMKFVEGRTLDQVLKANQRIEPELVASIGARVAEALNFAHSEEIIHRDVKPSNIIIDTHGRPVVTDFGIAKVTSARSITMTGSMLGTPAYMSPEQCKGLQATAASDQYSLGVMMYEMLTGRAPFDGTIFELITAHCTDTPPAMREIVPGIPLALEATVMRMLSKSPADRFASLSDVAKQLTSATPRRSQAAELQANIARIARASGRAGTGQHGEPSIVDLASAPTEMVTTPAPGLVVSPAEGTLEVGDSLVMRAHEAGGAAVVPSSVTWRSEDPTIATVDGRGLVVGQSAGFTKITATRGPSFGRAALTVITPATVLVPGTAPIADPAGVASARTRSPVMARAFAGGAAILVVSAIAYAAFTLGAGGSAPAPSPTAAKVDSTPPASPPILTPPPAVPTAADSAAAAAVVAAKAESTRKAVAKAKSDSAAARQVAERCRRLQAQFQLGGDLTEAEKTFIRTQCK